MDRRPIPVYYQLALNLRGRIVSGEFPVGCQLPIETALMAEFGVGRHSVRAAVQQLAQDGLVESFPGRGTFVVAPQTQRSRWGLDSIEDLIESSKSHAYAVLGGRFVTARHQAGLTSVFGVAADARLFFVRALRSSELGPYGYSRIHLPAEIGERIPPALLPTRPFLVLAETHAGAVAVHARQTIGCAAATADASKVLEIAPKSPVLVMQRTYYAEDGRAIVHSLVQARPDRYEQVINIWRRGSGTGATVSRLLPEPVMATASSPRRLVSRRRSTG
jgi:GntR family transcriptional regulator